MIASLLVAATLLAPGLAPGPHPVGLRLLDVRDASRRLDGQPRPIQLALWYPAGSVSGPTLTYGDYVGLDASLRTLGWPTPDAASTARARRQGFLTSHGVPAAAVSAAFALQLRATRDASPAAGRFPLVLIAQGNGQSAADQAVLAEHLASHGFAVASSPSQILLGDAMESDADVLPSARQQARDLALLATTAGLLGFVDASRLSFVGHSFGARAALLAALDDPRTTALVSLDGGIGSSNAAGWLDPRSEPRLARAQFPLLHVYEDADAAMMAPSFTLLLAMRDADRQLVRVPGLHHRHFTSLGWAAAAVPGLDEADALTATRCDAIARVTRRFLTEAFGHPEPAPEPDAAGLVRWRFPPDTGTRRFVAGPAGPLRVDDGGAGGLPVVFVHGNGADLGHWAPQLQALRRTRRAIAFDLRGDGGSQPLTNPAFGVADVAGDVAAVADGLGLTRFALVAHSYGAAVAGAYAGAHPERVAGLLLLDPAGDVSRAPRAAIERYQSLLESDFERASHAALEPALVGASEATRAQVLASLAAAAPEAFLGSFTGLSLYDPVPALRAYPGPRQIVMQEKQRGDASSLCALLPEIRCRFLTAGSHWLMLDTPADVDAELTDFLATLEVTR